jgi:predicted small integral membrane protein
VLHENVKDSSANSISEFADALTCRSVNKTKCSASLFVAVTSLNVAFRGSNVLEVPRTQPSPEPRNSFSFFQNTRQRWLFFVVLTAANGNSYI